MEMERKGKERKELKEEGNEIEILNSDGSMKFIIHFSFASRVR